MLNRTPLGLRDQALLLLGFAGAFRRSGLVSLDVEDLEFTPAAFASSCVAPRPIKKRWAGQSACRTA